MPPLHHPCVDPRFALVPAERQSADVESDGERQLGSVAELLRRRILCAVRGSEGVHGYYQRRHSGEYWRSRIRSSTLRLSMKTVKTWIKPMKA